MCVRVGGQFKAEQHDMENKTLILKSKKQETKKKKNTL